MDISIRGYIKNNFKNSSDNEINTAIEDAINEGKEEALPGLGALFELLWTNSSASEKNSFSKKIKNQLK
ncbi:MAG: small acid-soluble spore protein SspI [Bacilli bacterium]|nr:small acid-soluble spore protein SspI [Bacilli bacterium]